MPPPRGGQGVYVVGQLARQAVVFLSAQGLQLLLRPVPGLDRAGGVFDAARVTQSPVAKSPPLPVIAALGQFAVNHDP